MALIQGDDSLSSVSDRSGSRSSARSASSSRRSLPRSGSNVSGSRSSRRSSRSPAHSASRSPSRSRSPSPRSRSPSPARSAASSRRSAASSARASAVSAAGGSQRAGSAHSSPRSSAKSSAHGSASPAEQLAEASASDADEDEASGSERIEDAALKEEEEEELAPGEEFINRETNQIDVTIVLEAITGANKLRARRALEFYLDAFLVNKQFARRGNPLPALNKKLAQVAFSSERNALVDLKRILEVLLFLIKSDSNVSADLDKEGATPTLLAVVGSRRVPHESRLLAARILDLVVTPSNDAARANLVNAGGVPLLCKMLSVCDEDLAVYVGGVLERVLERGGAPVQEQVLKSGGMHGLVLALNSSMAEIQRVAAKSISRAVAKNHGNQDAVRMLHGLSLLVRLMQSNDEQTVLAGVLALQTACVGNADNATELFYATGFTAASVRALRRFGLDNAPLVKGCVEAVLAVCAGANKRLMAFVDEGILLPLTALVDKKNEDARRLAVDIQTNFPAYVQEMHPKILERLARDGLAEPKLAPSEKEQDVDYFEDELSDDGDDDALNTQDNEDFENDEDERGYDMLDSLPNFWPGTQRTHSYKQWAETGTNDEMALAARLDAFSPYGTKKEAKRERALREQRRREYIAKQRLRELDGRLALQPSLHSAIEDNDPYWSIINGMESVQLGPPPPPYVPRAPLPQTPDEARAHTEALKAVARPQLSATDKQRSNAPAFPARPSEQETRTSGVARTTAPFRLSPAAPAAPPNYMAPSMPRFHHTAGVPQQPMQRQPAGYGWYREVPPPPLTSAIVAGVVPMPQPRQHSAIRPPDQVLHSVPHSAIRDIEMDKKKKRTVLSVEFSRPSDD